VGARFRATNTVSDFTGTIIVTNNAKTELSVSGPGPFSPINTGKFLLYCGTYAGLNTVTADGSTGYLELNVRNNGPDLVRPVQLTEPEQADLLASLDDKT
jgi:hypothetical protein